MTPRALVPVMCLFLMQPMLVQAAAVDGLYEASVPVSEQSAAERERGIRNALGIILIRTTGQRAVPQQARVADLMADAPRLVQQFRYEQRPVVDDDTGEIVPRLHLWARFDPAAIQRALVERGIPVWGRERPTILVWIAHDDGFQRGILDDTSPEVFRAAVAQVATLRGLPVLWPLMDLQDRNSLAFTDIWGGFEDRIMAASARYGANAVLVGRLYRADGGRWAARWSVIEDSGTQAVETAPGLIHAVLSDGVHWLADGIGERAAVLADSMLDGRARLTVHGIGSMADYAAAMQYVGSLSAVSAVAIDRIEHDRVVFALELRGSEAQLRQVISLGTVLDPMDDGNEWEGFDLHYRLRL